MSRAGLTKPSQNALGVVGRIMSKEKTSALRVCAICIVGFLVGCASSPQAKEAKFLKRGQTFLAKKDYARALLEFRNAANVMPKDAEPHYQTGLVYLETGDLASAVGAFQKATTLNPKHAGAQLRLADLMTTSQTKSVLEDAEKRLQGLLAATPDSLDALDTLAVAESKLGKLEDAAQLLDQALKRFPADLRSAVMLARLKVSQNDSMGAEEVLRKAVASAPRSSDAALMLGRLYIQHHKDSQAEAEIRRALELDAKNAPALLSLALIQMNTNRPGDAEQTYKQLAALPTKDYKPIYGLFLFQQGRQDAALLEFLRLANADPDDREARTRLVAAYVITNRIPQAEGVLADALKRNRKDTDALLQRSELRLRAGDTTGAAKDLQEVLKFKPDSAEAHLELAKVMGLQGLALSVRQELNESLRLNPNHLAARIALARSLIGANEAKTALELMEGAPQSQRNTLGVLIERNWALLGLGKLKEARLEIDRGLRFSRAPELLEQDGFLKMKEGDFAGARTDAEELLGRYPEQDPHNIMAVRLLVDSCVALHQRLKAVEVLREMVSKRPKSAQLQTMLGRVLVTFGSPAEGRTAFEAAEAADPKFLPAKMELAQIDLSENRLDSARQKLSMVVASDPRNINALLMLADTEATAGHRPAAIAKYRSVLDLDSANVLALRSLANMIAVDNSDEALKLAQQAVEIAPEDASTQDTLGWVFYRKGLYRTAVEHLKMAAAKEPTPRRTFHLAMSYLKAGDRNLGQQMLAAALRQDPNLAKTEQGW
jgi:tetratricopeptide (TPR) repeat protein